MIRHEEEIAARAKATEARLQQACNEKGFAVTADGRIGESDATALLQYSPGSLKNLRDQGVSPAFYRRAVGKQRVSYRLDDIAHWIESARDVDVL